MADAADFTGGFDGLPTFSSCVLLDNTEQTTGSTDIRTSLSTSRNNSKRSVNRFIKLTLQDTGGIAGSQAVSVG